YGIGTLLLGQLAGVAALHGITELVASVMATNQKMLDVFDASGFPISRRSDGSMIEISLPTAISGDVLSAFDRRQHTASRSAVSGFLRPASLAVIGAS